MKATFKKSELLKELQKSAPFVERKTTIPILSNFLFVAAPDSVEITATNLDVTRKVTVSAQVKTEGKCTIPAHKLLNCLKNLKTVEDDSVTIEHKATACEEVHEHTDKCRSRNSDWINLSCGPLKVSLAGMTASNYPSILTFPPTTGKGKANVVKLKGEVLAGLIARTQYAIATEETRYTLNGALLQFKEDEIRMVTTDGHRLANVSHNGHYKVAKDKEFKMIVPKDTLANLRTLLTSDELRIAKDDTHIYFQSGNWTVISRPLTGQFPNYNAVIPQSKGNVLTVEREKLLATLTRVLPFADERSRAVKFKFHEEGVTLSTFSIENGEASETVKASYAGDPFLSGFNGQYLVEALRASEGESVRITERDAHSAALLTPATDGEYKVESVLMPMRV